MSAIRAAIQGRGLGLDHDTQVVKNTFLGMAQLGKRLRFDARGIVLVKTADARYI